MKRIETQISIEAPPQKVWNVLTDFEQHTKWNPFIESIKGDKKVGSTLTVTLHPPGVRATTFKPRILVFDEGKEFRWRGKFGVNGLFDGEHYFILSPQEDEGTLFIHGEKFSGILVPLLGRILKDTKNGFLLMNKALKRRCEATVY